MAANYTGNPVVLPTEETAHKLEALFQEAYDKLESVAMGASHSDSLRHGLPQVELADIGALVVVCDRVDVQLQQGRQMLEVLRRSLTNLITMRAEQQGRLSRGEAI